MTETSSKGVLRSATVMFLFVGLLGIWTGGCEKLTQEQKVERLIKQLGHQKVKVRLHAAEILGKIGEGAKDVVPALMQALQDQDEDVRRSAALALGQIGTPEAIKVAVPALIQALQDKDHDEDVRMSAAGALGEIGADAKDAVPALIQALQDKDQMWRVRTLAAEALGKIGPDAKDVVPALMQAFQDQDEDVRRSTALALGQIGTPEAIKAAEGEVPVLIQTLQDQDADVRASAADVLGQIGESVKDKNSFVIVDAVPALIQALKNDYNVRVRSRTAMALGDIRSEDAVPSVYLRYDFLYGFSYTEYWDADLLTQKRDR